MTSLLRPGAAGTATAVAVLLVAFPIANARRGSRVATARPPPPAHGGSLSAQSSPPHTARARRALFLCFASCSRPLCGLSGGRAKISVKRFSRS